MTNKLLFVSTLFALVLSSPARSDFIGPSVARRALSPNGELLVRIETARQTDKPRDVTVHDVTFYRFDASKNAYIVDSSFQLTEHLSQLVFVSDEGDLVMICLSEKAAIRLYDKRGEVRKSWDLQDFLSKKEIAACAKTGSTLQWFDDAMFEGREFVFYGPSHRIRALGTPSTIMRGANEKIKFTAILDAKTSKLQKYGSDNP